jgi:hypothetical protein
VPTAITGLDHAKLTTVVEPLVELGGALHVLDDPGHHDALDWANTVKGRLSPALADATERWAWTTRAIRSAPFVTASSTDFDTALRTLRSENLAEQLLRPVVRRAAASRGPVVASLLDRPVEATAEFLWFLHATWREWFGFEWQRLRPALTARARRFTDSAKRHGAAPALTTVDAAVTRTGSGVSLDKLQNARHDVAERGLAVAPSSFVRPHLYVADVPGQPLLLIHPVEPGPSVPSVAELVSRLETVANRGAVARRPHAGQPASACARRRRTGHDGPAWTVRPVPPRHRCGRATRWRPRPAAAALTADRICQSIVANESLLLE